MPVHRVVTLLLCLVPVGGAAVWLEAYRFRLEQRLTELADRHEQLREINARLRSQLAQDVAPAFASAVDQLPAAQPDATWDPTGPQRPPRLSDRLSQAARP